MKISTLDNKKIAILGFGLTGKEVYASLVSDYDVTIINDNPVPGYEVYNANQAWELNLEFDIVIKSPGVFYSNPFLQWTKAEITNDIELSYQYIKEQNLDTKIVAVTGTNGKTTTTQFVCDVLNEQGYVANTCGNIGQSPLTVLDNSTKLDYLVMELSSYQLKQVNTFKPDFGLFLNISPDHIDYHGDFEDYINSKCNLFKNMTTKDKLVLDKSMIENNSNIDWPNFATTGCSEELLNKVTTPTMPKQNCVLIIDLLLQLGIDSKVAIDAINNFKGLEHRLEVVECDYDFDIINDSKATNIEATNVAINSMVKPTTLIVGGSEKVEDYTKLHYLDKHIKYIIAYGDTREKFGYIPNVMKYEYFEDAVLKGLEITGRDEVLLLSPACASFDQHTSYVNRGYHFKQIVKGE